MTSPLKKQALDELGIRKTNAYPLLVDDSLANGFAQLEPWSFEAFDRPRMPWHTPR